MVWILLVILSPIIIVVGMVLFGVFLEPIMEIAMKHPDKLEKIEKIYNWFHRKKRK